MDPQVVHEPICVQHRNSPYVRGVLLEATEVDEVIDVGVRENVDSECPQIA